LKRISGERIKATLSDQWRGLGAFIAVLLLVNVLVAVRDASRLTEPAASSTLANPNGSNGSGTGTGTGTEVLGEQVTRPNVPPPASTLGSIPNVRGLKSLPPGVKPGVTRTLLPGVNDKELLVAYYWKGDRTKTSPYLNQTGSGQEGNVDEAEAFRAMIAWINKHADDGSEFLGYKFNLHGRKLVGHVKEAGQYPDDYAATAEYLAKDLKLKGAAKPGPFAAISSHGSLSAYICPRMAKAGIFNPSTYDLDWGLYAKTNGYCMSAGQSWADQVEAMVAYVSKQVSKTEYLTAGVGQKRVYGILYAEYPGLIDSAPKVKALIEKAGVPVKSIYSIAADLTTGQGMAPSLVNKFRGDGVNTLIIPDAGAPLNFTHAAQANGYNPDYIIWPCSGQDNAGMVRLYNAGQWTRASGLTCYDEHFNPDLTNDGISSQTEWWKMYKEVKPNSEPPSPTPFVAQSFIPILAGITEAGSDLTLETFRVGLTKFKPYRYDAIEGRTTNPRSMLVTVDMTDGGQIGDAAKLRWDPAKRTPGATTTGAYDYPENKRYKRATDY